MEEKHMEHMEAQPTEPHQMEAHQEAHHPGAAGAAPGEVAAMPRRREENTVFIGKKGTMGYVLAVVTQFNNGANEVAVKARGKLISRAVDVVEIVRHRFMPSAQIKDILITTEELTSEDGSKNKVSSIEIKLQK